ncbi:UDP-glucose--hexose-1-phosphate uridylyltransferase [Halalkalibacterium halodurans]|uniref:Galactose-1-phosphate uridylyltransferase n=1 Tax=Halalkalibacterium halodurans (strain ATCC BAA-125 / DSM 18197 / FERM 7344 / JCM 9153 / C-125) TaxID=272558 RepID=GALT_HALH5|nr:UDP-glucose--hexose-1-phosphate uridylyltransferase [Halalkalibacterium halodurans]Q9KDV2.1 RecName: Full=Galactose-1-phosphate uridylyltransferase; Short=Gal-1-P uridylyltransferase; AltName: Full=UDP-glucose--hexose-1-phosphate uridylyltransferase [Halalkalibacterium halodurans C-125]MED4171652.1 UDP-glucose--hexose-1-phosphate uridylyltransferase [Halalkalibacterium halodurans]BAB04828.1 galactose-1-phosphate uridyltransferase [Halalkalibacterium halodurans C-125]
MSQSSIAIQIEALLTYALQHGLITKWDIDASRNRVLDVLDLDELEPVEQVDVECEMPYPILENILDWAAENGRLEANTVTYRDLLDTKLMGALLGQPSETIRTFYERYEQQGPEEATKVFYDFSKQVHYIRTDRIAKNEHWFSETPYGQLEITINLSKPEKDPKAIAQAKHLQASSYPKCLLCKENVGYRGRVNHPARQNLRVIPVELNQEQWYMQFSPYVYYNEHAIVFSGEHVPMKISTETFARLLEFTEKFPHYFIGSNADLPIVGGSILSHDHFQGGNHAFPMAKASMEKTFSISRFPSVIAGIVKWPMSVVRLQGMDRSELVKAADHVYHAWQAYGDEAADIYPFTGDTPHNTITPIARRRGELFELDLVLRNNRTSKEHPDGIFHPHQEVHHIKKENIGLIEVMGLAVLPGRLKEELELLAEALLSSDPRQVIARYEQIQKHEAWALAIKERHAHLHDSNVMDILRDEIGKVFATILAHAGVFKRTGEGAAAFDRFISTLNQ